MGELEIERNIEIVREMPNLERDRELRGASTHQTGHSRRPQMATPVIEC